MDLSYSTTPYEIEYGINSELYNHVSVEDMSASVRLFNVFMRNKVFTIGDLLRRSPAELMGFRNFGRNCLLEVDAYLSSLPQMPLSQPEVLADTPRVNLIKENAPNIIRGDFSFAYEGNLSEEELDEITPYIEAYETLGKDLVETCVYTPEKIQPIKDVLKEFVSAANQKEIILGWLNLLPKHRQGKRVVNYINAYSNDPDIRLLLQSFFAEASGSFFALRQKNTFDNYSAADIMQLKLFLKWCSYDLRSEIEEILSSILRTERLQTVIFMRAQKYTLEQTGNRLGVTRERVRQLEAKAQREFNVRNSKVRILAKIAAEKNGATVLTRSDIEEYCPSHGEELLFFLCNSETSRYFIYDAQLELFTAIGDSLKDRLLAYFETLPDILNVNTLSEILSTAQDDYGLPSDLVEKTLLETYRITGDVYHRSRLSLATVYTKILQSHYPDGMHVYDPEELQRFRSLVAEEFGDIGMPENDRALSSRLASICILCGKGRYRTKKDHYIPNALAKKIYNYIMDQDSPIFLTNTLFDLFGAELKPHGIDNKYYLQGVLHELYKDKLIFSRDYISKDASITSIYSSIVSYIKEFSIPVNKNTIREKFPAVPDHVIAFATGDPSILNLFGQYLHVSKLEISESERDYLAAVMKKVLSDGKTHHSAEIHDIVMQENPAILTRNGVMFPSSTSSFLECLFRNEYQFDRRCIAKMGVPIERPVERLYEFIYAQDKITFSEIQSFAESVRYLIYSYLELAESCNDQYLLIDNETMMRISSLGITEDIAASVEELVCNAINGETSIFSLCEALDFPVIRVPWSEWLVYSVLLKWGKRVKVSTSSNQIRYASAFVSPCDQADAEHGQSISIASGFVGHRVVLADDLSNLDDIINATLADDILESSTWDLEI